jgi:hypothetical protein
LEKSNTLKPRSLSAGKSAAGLRTADPVHLGQHAQALEDRDIHRQQRFADVEARMAAFFEQLDLVAPARQFRGRRGTGRSAADDDDVAIRAASHVVFL